MFIRIARGEHESTHECSRYYVRPESKDTFLVVMERDYGRTVEEQIDKSVPEALGVYLMNDRGVTIDTLFRKEADSA